MILNGKIKKAFQWAGAAAAMCLLFATVMIAVEASRPHQFEGQIKLICDPKDKVNLSSPTDVLQANVTIPFDVAGIATNKQIASRFAWLGKSLKGRDASWSLGQPGSAEVSPLEGKVVLHLPFQASLNGVAFQVPITLTTESETDGYGATQGTRAQVSHLEAPLALVGGFEFSIDKQKLNPASKETGIQKVVVRAIVTGHFKATDGKEPFSQADRPEKEKVNN